MAATRRIRIAHSPDSDDAYMFYALPQGVLDLDGLQIDHVLSDIESLNQAAFDGAYEITALSFHAYAHLADRYLLMPSGASFGDGYGPVVIATRELGREELPGLTTAVPGELTTAALALKLWQPAAKTRVVPFDSVFEEVASGRADAGVVIHEGQLTFERRGFVPVVDLGAWWRLETGGPLPLGGNGIRRDLEPDLRPRLCRLLTESMAYGLEHRAEALAFSSRYARELEGDPALQDRFVGMYVNELFRRAALFVGSDSGPMHIACFVKTPSVVIYGPTDPVVNAPYRHSRFIVLRKDVSCNPCRIRDCSRVDCTNAISPEEVFNAAAELLSGPKAYPAAVGQQVSQ